MHDVAERILWYVRASLAYRWYAIGFAWVAALGGWAGVYWLPDRYEASARVFVDTQSVLRPLLQGLAIQPNVQQIVAMMSRTLMSRPNMEKVARMADLDIKAATPAEREKLLNELQTALTIKTAGGENLYTIAYADNNPQVAKTVVQSLLTIFVEGSLVDKRKDTDTARRFIEDQLKTYADKLTAAEQAMVEFKQKHFGVMGSSGSYYGRLGEAKAALEQTKLSLQEAEKRREAIQKQQTGEEEALPNLLPSLSPDEPATGTAAPALTRSSFDSRIEGLEQKLDQLRLTYTEKHPDIISAKRMMDELKQLKEKELKELEEKRRQAEERRREQAKNKKAGPSGIRSLNPAVQMMANQVAEAEAQVAALKARVAAFEKRYDDLRAAANSVPQVETEYAQLTREYDVTKRNYDSLLARRETAQLSGDMESNTNVVEFRVVDPPQVPLKPNWPNRPRFMSLVFLASLAGGFGLAFILSQVWPTIREERQLREVTGLPVLGTVIMAWTPEQKAKRRKGLAVLIGSLVSLLSAYAAVMVAITLVAAKS